jgi:triosephosphate isomerase (TIM)
MRVPLIAGNWKMYKTVQEAVFFVKELRGVLKEPDDVEVVVAPPFTAVHSVAEAVRNSSIGVAAQDLYWEREGAFTGEVSAAMIAEAGAEYVIVGHSERRRLFGETDQHVSRKIAAAMGAALTPIVCVGETLDERERDQTMAVLDRQIKDGLDGVPADRIADLVIAYEPVWAIGTGQVATPDDAQEMCGELRTVLAERYSGDLADGVRILYGGSVKAGNAAELMAKTDVDGALVGGASLDGDEFAAICRAALPAPQEK